MFVQSQEDSEREQELIFFRSLMYREFSRLYRYPDQGWFESFPGICKNITQALEVFSKRLKSSVPVYPNIWHACLSNLERTVIEAEYVRLFEYDASCCPYESSYISHLSPQKIHDSVRASYKCAGLVCLSSPQELPDHFTLECEFMHYLSYVHGQELGKWETERDKNKWVGLQDRFLKDHLWQWIGPFCRCLFHSSGLELYKSLAEMTEWFILNDQVEEFQ
ncbi:MAG TPA: molecular chaperone TorD family protein [Desulfohalobiaceae bacterium]|nr:molecular chaperone TorD family protein [Desulfohalobiaceae bacterium]